VTCGREKAPAQGIITEYHTNGLSTAQLLSLPSGGKSTFPSEKWRQRPVSFIEIGPEGRHSEKNAY
jgi:hypothetical protein